MAGWVDGGESGESRESGGHKATVWVGVSRGGQAGRPGGVRAHCPPPSPPPPHNRFRGHTHRCRCCSSGTVATRVRGTAALHSARNVRRSSERWEDDERLTRGVGLGEVGAGVPSAFMEMLFPCTSAAISTPAAVPCCALPCPALPLPCHAQALHPHTHQGPGSASPGRRVRCRWLSGCNPASSPAARW